MKTIDRILIISAVIFLILISRLLSILLPYHIGKQEYREIKNLAVTSQINKKEKSKQEFSVDFDALLSKNPDTIAWIRFDEPSVISYPVVKSTDNVEYLTKTFLTNDNKLGSIFVDMRNKSNFTDRNTFIYGHNLKVGGEMFSQLTKYESEEFCRQHPYFYIYTPDHKRHTYKVFSAAIVKDTAENYQITFATESEYVDYLQMCRESSNYQTDAALDATSKIVSLSTCTNINEDERFLVQGVEVSK